MKDILPEKALKELIVGLWIGSCLYECRNPTVFRACKATHDMSEPDKRRIHALRHWGAWLLFIGYRMRNDHDID